MRVAREARARCHLANTRFSGQIAIALMSAAGLVEFADRCALR